MRALELGQDERDEERLHHRSDFFLVGGAKKCKRDGDWEGKEGGGGTNAFGGGRREGGEHPKCAVLLYWRCFGGVPERGNHIS